MPRKSRYSTFSVPIGTCLQSIVWERVRRYTKMAHLLITKHPTESFYNITHAMSGTAVVRFRRLTHARKALPLLLLVTDWSRDAEHYRFNTELFSRVRKIRDQVEG